MRRNRWKTDGNPSLYSLHIEKDKIISNKLKKIYFTGKKDVYKITTRKGFSIKSTKEHRVWTPFGWNCFGNLNINDCVGILRSDIYQIPKRNYGNNHKKIKELWKELKQSGCSLCGIKTSLEIHHIDNNPFNNDKENLQVVCSHHHKKVQIRKSQRKEQDYEFDKIVSIEYVGKEDCYDIEMEGDENIASFIANDFIVHNCKPKHNSLAYDRIPKDHVMLFDVQIGLETYLDPEELAQEAARLGLESVPVVFRGKIDTSEQIKEMLERTSVLGGQKIEGVVIKNYERFNTDGKVMMGKYVSEAFKEVHRKEWKQSNPTKKDVVETMKDEYRSQARWNKAIIHGKEEGWITDTPKDIGRLIKEIQQDLHEEERDSIKERLYKWAMPHIQRASIAGFPEYYKKMLMEKQFEFQTDEEGEE